MSIPAPILLYNLASATTRGLLPNGYTPLAYIYTDGTHVIDTGYQPTASTRLLFKASDMNSMYIGARSDSFDYTGANMYSFYAPDVNLFRRDWLGWTDTAPFSNSYEVFAYEGNLYINGVKYERSVTKQAIARNFYIGGVNGAGTGNAKFYYVRLWSDANTLVRDMIPAINSSNVVGMYDVCGNTWYACTGAIAGPPLAIGKGGGKSLPEEYLLVEYLESNGSSASPYIRFTDRALAANDILSIEASILRVDNNAQPSIMGESGIAQIYFPNRSLSYWLTSYIQGTSPAAGTTITLGTKYTFNSTIKQAITNWNLFTYTPNYYPANARIELVIISRSSNVIMHLFPCYRKSDMKPGMYDTVNGVFYTNAGSGEFILGPTVNAGYTWEPNVGSGHNYIPENRRFTTPVTVSHVWGNDSDRRFTLKELGLYNGLTVTFSADLSVSSSSPVSGGIEIEFYHTDSDRPSYASSAVSPGQTKRVYVIATIPSNTNYYGINLRDAPNPNQGTTAVTQTISNLKLELGSVATPFIKGNGLYTNVSGIYDSSKGWVADFNGNNCLIVNTATNSILPNNQFSVSIWAKRRGNNTSSTLFGFGAELASIVLEGSRWFIYDTSNNPYVGFYTAKDTNWHHYIITYNKSTLKLYVDALEIGSVSTTANLKNNTYIDIGGRYGGGEFDGQLTNFTLWDLVLTLDQIKELYGKN